MPATAPDKIARTVVTMRADLADGSFAEMIYRPELHETAFAVCEGMRVIERDWLDADGLRFVPYSPRNNLLTHRVVLLPSRTEEYLSVELLVQEIREFIHRYVDLEREFEELATWYVLLSWRYDEFNELPYLRVVGDYGTGKSRFLLVVGSLCYKSIFASGASTVSPLFRILDAVQGTLVIDEADFRFSDERAQLVKIFNNGNARGFPVLRTEVTPAKELNPRAFHVFGPKLIAARRIFDDPALESRCITARLGDRPLRADIPLNLPPEFEADALQLRNMLLLYRFRMRANRDVAAARMEIDGVEPRASQLFVPFLSIVTEAKAHETILGVARRHSDLLRADRSARVEALVLEAIAQLIQEGKILSMRQLADRFAERFGADFGRPITPRWIGGIVRRRLGLVPQKSHGVFVIPPTELPKLEYLFTRYGLRDVGDVGDQSESPGPLEKL